MSRKTEPYDLAEALRAEIAESGLSAYRVAIDAGVDRSVMTRFVNGERGLTLDTASRLCEFLDLRLAKTKGR